MAVIGQDHGFLVDVGEGPPVPVSGLAPTHFIAFGFDFRGDVSWVQMERADDVLVQHGDMAASDGAHGDLGLIGHAELAYDAGVHGQDKAPRNLRGNHNTSARKAHHQAIWFVFVLFQEARQAAASVDAVMQMPRMGAAMRLKMAGEPFTGEFRNLLHRAWFFE